MQNFNVAGLAEISEPNEVWRQSSIAIYYWISNKGRVYSTLSCKLIQPEISKDGYQRVFLLTETGTFKHYFVHFLVATEFLQKPKGATERLQIHHISGDKCDNSAANLIWVTPKQHRAIHDYLKKHRELWKELFEKLEGLDNLEGGDVNA